MSIIMLAALRVATLLAIAQAADTVAVVDVSVVPMDSAHVLSHQTVVVANARIVALGDKASVAIPRSAQQIDGRGKFLLPALSDMHVHLSTSEEFPLYVGNGVLTVRDLNGSPETLAWRDSIARRLIVGPRLFVSGPMIAGPDIPWRNKVVPRTAAEADSEVVRQRGAGYDQIKIYDGISAEVFAGAMAAAKRVGMRSSGHIPRAVGFDGVLASGMGGLEHLDKTVAATMGHQLDTTKVPDIVEKIRRAGVYVTPTLESMVQLSLVATGRYDSLMNRPEAKGAPGPLREFWTGVTSRLKGNRTPDPTYRYNAYADMQLRLAGALAAAGVPLLSGTDLPNVVLVPGVSLHRELSVMREAGLTPYQVLETSTRRPAEFFGESADWGTVAVGKRANLLLVSANPLDDLATLSAPDAVLLGDRVFDRATLAAMRRGESSRTR